MLICESGHSKPSSPVIVYFDGVCGFCNAAVNLLMKWDRHGTLMYAPLQGETAANRLEPAETTDPESLIISIGDHKYRKSAAVVRLLWKLGGVCWLGGCLLWLIPKPVRDLMYTLIARFRYQIFGKKDSCRLPTPEERERFLP